MSKIAYTSLEELYSLFQAHSVITTDTRHCPEGSLFFALRGERFDGNAVAQQALHAGCAVAVVDDPAVGGDERLLHVPDVLTTLQQLAALHRRTLGTPIVQRTGSNGKTTAKELPAAVLARKFDLLCTQGNFNNHIGVPKTLLQLRPHHQMAVIETGANHPGEIALLTDLVQPECGLITNVGMAHLEGFGSFEGVMRTKGELYDYLRHKPGGFIFLHADNAHLCRMAGSLPAVRYGLPGHDCYTEGEVLACTPFLRLRFRTQGGAWHEVQTHLIGAYNVANVLAAAAVGAHFGVPDVDIAEALAAYEPTNNRSEWMRTQRNELIVDAYNANPTSMKAALDNFALIAHDHKMAILGEMRELGTASDEAHRAVAAQAASLHCEEVWLVGEAFRAHAAGARWFPSVAEVKAALEAEGAPTGRLILVKGSNGTRLFELPGVL